MKKIVILALVLSMAISITSCDKKEETDDLIKLPIIDAKEIKYSTETAKRGYLATKHNVIGEVGHPFITTISFAGVQGNIKEIKVEQGQNVSAGDVIATIESGEYQKELNEQKNKTEQARLRVDILVEENADKDEILFAKIEHELELVKLEKARENLENCTLKSPISGRIDWLEEFFEGQHIKDGELICGIADTSKPYVYFYSEDASVFRHGMSAAIVTDDDSYKGKVISAPVSAPYGASHEAANMVIIDLIDEIKLDNLDKSANLPDDKHGEPRSDGIAPISEGKVIVEIIIEEREEAIIIPADAILKFSGRKYVNLLMDDVKIETNVEVGLETEKEVEIISGIREGDMVILN